jgi:hypothetical protein
VSSEDSRRQREEVQRRANGWRAIDEIVILDDVLRQTLEEQQRFVHLDMAGIDGDDDVPGVEKGVQYSYMNFISGNRILPPVRRNFRCIASAETSAMFPFFSRTAVRSKILCSGKPNTLSRIKDSVPTTSPSYFAHKVVVVGKA